MHRSSSINSSSINNLSQLFRQLYSLYTINTLVVLFAVCLALMPERPAVLQSLDDQLFNAVADSSQKRMMALENGDAEVPTAFGLDSIFKSVDDVLSGSLFFWNDARDSLTPAWYVLVERGLILLAAFLLVTGLRRLSLKTSAKLVLGTAVGLLTAQAALLKFGDQWLPVGVVVQYAAISFTVLLLQLGLEKELDATRQRLHAVAVSHAKLLSKKGGENELLHTLEHCIPCPETYDLAYNFAVDREQKRQYDQALTAYELIYKQDKRFKDVSTRLSNLKAANDRSKRIQSSPVPLEATMIVDAGVTLPTLGRYEVVRELGRGAMGIVYLGKDPKIAREVAIKTLSYKQFAGAQLEELRDRFFREAKAAGRLAHPNIVTVFDVGEEQDLAYIAMDFIEGTALDAYCKPKQLLPVETVYHIMLQVAEALSYAHKQKIVHRDIKPSNLIYNPASHQVKVSDFGIARMTDESKTKTGQVMGSPVYMSPEQLKGRAVTGAADIFSLGATFYQLLTGSTPFVADNLPELTIKIMSKKHKSVRDLNNTLPASAVRITNKALNKDPDKRFANAEEMAVQIRKALQNDFSAKVA